VREESQLDAMRAAIRGDFERLAERRGDQDLLRVAEDVPVDSEPEAEPAAPEPAGTAVEPPVEPVQPELALDAPLEPEAVELPGTEPEPVPEAPDEPEAERVDEAPPRRSFLDRLLGR
jgi:hypothetical protein